MCGIVGVVGKAAKAILLNGLTKLEYRGYDSAGIYVANQSGREYLVKTQGKIADLKAKVGPEVEGDFGIGHTRWATHGVPSEENAHPHFSNDKRFYLVHNGVIENYQELRNKYLKQVQFHSQTDTEVVVQLIDQLAIQKHLSAFEAFQEALKLIKGSYAFLLIDHEEPEKIFVAKNKSPLLIGLGDHFNVLASDAMAVLDQTHRFIALQDGDVAVVTSDSVQIKNRLNQPVNRQPYTVHLDASDTNKGPYDFYMLKEINEQPAVMRALSKAYLSDSGKPIIDSKIVESLQKADRIYILAAGTSYNAGLVGKVLFEHWAHIPVEVGLASEFGHHFPLLSKHPFFIFLSQSGETADSRVVLTQVNDRKLPSLTITNVDQSTLAREATYQLLLHAGPEIAVASTKAYTAQIATQAILAKALGEVRQIKAAQNIDLKKQLAIVAEGMQEIIEDQERLNELTKKFLGKTRNAFYIGRGIDYAVCEEAALKLKEVSYIQTEGFAAAELKHGTIALIEKGTPVIALINDPATADLTRGNIKEVQARGANVITIVSNHLALLSDDVVLSDVAYELTPLLSVIPAQLLAYNASKNRGLNVDQPRNLAKAVTVE